MQDFTFVITEKNIHSGTLTVVYTPTDNTLLPRTMTLNIWSDKLTGTANEIRAKLRKQIVECSPQGDWLEEKYRLSLTIPPELDALVGDTTLAPVLDAELNSVLDPIILDGLSASYIHDTPTGQVPKMKFSFTPLGYVEQYEGNLSGTYALTNSTNWCKIISNLVGGDYWIRFSTTNSPGAPDVGSINTWQSLSQIREIGWENQGSTNDPALEINLVIEIAGDSQGSSILKSKAITLSLGYTV